MKERILCAAVHYKNGERYEHQPMNVESGIVVCGRRHHNALLTLMVILGDRPKLDRKEVVQGFLTSEDRFVDRKEAYLIAKEAGQIVIKNIRETATTLISEDLY